MTTRQSRPLTYKSAGVDIGAGPAPFADGATLGEALLEPTRIYVAACLAAHGEVVHGIGSIIAREDGAAAVVVSGAKGPWGASGPWRAQGGGPVPRP